MKACVGLMLVIFGYFAHADVLGNLLAQKPDIALVLPEVRANGVRTVQELEILQRRALNHFHSASAYKQILSEGLISVAQKEYRRSTCDLLIEIFNEYLLLVPRPELDDVLTLISANGSFTADELVSLRRKALSIYLSADDYAKILKQGLESEHKEYKRKTVQILSETFAGYLQKEPKPMLEQALALIQPNGIFRACELVSFAREILAKYPEPMNIPSILESGLKSTHPQFRQSTVNLALKMIKEYVNSQNDDEDFIVWLKQLIALGVTIPETIALEQKLSLVYRQLLESDRRDEDLLAMITPAPNSQGVSLLFPLVEMHNAIRPQSLDAVLAHCQKFAGSIARACIMLVSKINAELTNTAIYGRISYLRTNGFSKTEAHNEYKKMLEDRVWAKLREEALKHLSSDKEGPHQEFSLAEPAPSKCPVCLEEMTAEERYRLQNCHHAICKTCLKNHIAAQLNGQAVLVKCTDPQCGRAISSADFSAVGEQEAQRRIRKNDLMKKIAQINGAHLCSNEHCPDAWIPPRHENDIEGPAQAKSRFERFSFSRTPAIDHHYRCRTCELRQCSQCGHTHMGTSCKHFQKTLKKTKKADREYLSGKNTRFKPCPKCSAAIEKNGGCDHMDCVKCGHKFYWSSLKPMK